MHTETLKGNGGMQSIYRWRQTHREKRVDKGTRGEKEGKTQKQKEKLRDEAQPALFFGVTKKKRFKAIKNSISMCTEW